MIGSDRMANRNTKVYIPFGKAVAKRMIDLDMDNTDLATQIGISPMYIYDILSGKRVAIERKKQIANVVGIRFEDYEGCC